MKKKNNKTNKTPESFGDIKKHLFKRGYKWFFKQGLITRIGFIVVLLFLLLIAARLDFLGKKPYTLSRAVIPVHLSFIDTEEVVIPLSFTYAIVDSAGTRIGKPNDQCHSGDRIQLYVTAGTDCWMSVIGIDAKTVYPMFNNRFGPHRAMGRETYPITFSLDSTAGTEAYYAIASKEKFDYEKDVIPEIDAVRKSVAKGPTVTMFDLRLKKGLAWQYIYFNHLH